MEAEAVAGERRSLRRGWFSLSLLLPFLALVAGAAYLGLAAWTGAHGDARLLAAGTIAVLAAAALGWRDGARGDAIFQREWRLRTVLASAVLLVTGLIVLLFLRHDRWLLAAAGALAYASYALSLAWTGRRSPRLWLVPVALVAAGATAWLAWQWQGTDGQSLAESTSVHEYHPFAPGNRLAPVTGDGGPRFAPGEAPRLDGATAAYPLYAALAQAFYTPESANAVAVSRTGAAYERLIRGEVDAIFVAQASEAHERLAREQGVTLRFTPIGREAFVFIVNGANRVRSLSSRQVRAIYAGRIERWDEVGGWPEPIVAYQRPENSGSQTVMLARVMQGEAMRPALREQMVQVMGPTVRRVSDYRNGRQALGYSFRYFVTGMHGQGGVRLLAIDGVEPTRENVRSGAYPFTVDVFMVTTERSRPQVERLRQWLLGPQGQKLVEDVGYVAR